MDELFTFISAEKYEKAKELVRKYEYDSNIPEIDRAEALESLGIIEFYNGEWEKAIQHLQTSLDYANVVKRRDPRRIAIMNLLMGSAKIRVNLISKGIECFEQCYKLSKTTDNFDLAAIAAANHAVALCKLKKYKDSIDYCKQAMEITAKMNSTTCFEYLQYSRTLVAILIKCGDFTRAEKMLQETEFSESERCLLEAGIDFARGKVDKSMKTLQSFRSNQHSTPHFPSVVPPFFKDLKPSFSSSSLLPPILEGATNPNSAAPSRMQSRAPSMKFHPMALEVDDEEEKKETSTNPNKLDEYGYGDEHQLLMEGSLPSFMRQIEQMMNVIMIEYNKALLCQRVVSHSGFSSHHHSSSATSTPLASRESMMIPNTTSSSFLLPPHTNNNTAGTIVPSASQVFQYPLKLMNDFISSLQELRLRCEKKEIDPYLPIPYGDYHPTFIPQDYYLFPMILFLLMMITHYEYEFMYRYYERQGMMLEKGNLIPLRGKPRHLRKKSMLVTPTTSNDDPSALKIATSNSGIKPVSEEEEEPEELEDGSSDGELKALEQQFLQIISLLESFQTLLPQPKPVPPIPGETKEDPGTSLAKDPLPHLASDSPEVSVSKEIVKNLQQFLLLKSMTSAPPTTSSSLLSPPPTRPGTVPHEATEGVTPLPAITNNTNPTATTTITTGETLASVAFPTLAGGERQSTLPNLSTPIVEESSKILKHHSVQLEYSTGRLVNDQSRLNAYNTAGESSSNNPPTPAEPVNRSRRNTNLRNSRNAMRKSKSGAVSGTTSTIGSFNNAVTQPNGLILLNPITQFPSDQYVPMIKDRLSYYSEILYQLDSFGRDELSSWITYALSSLSGISIGYLGQTVVDGEEIFRFLEKKFSTDSPAQAVMKPPPVGVLNINPATTTTTTTTNTTAVTASNPSSRPGTSSGTAAALTSNLSPESQFLLEVRERLLEIETKLTVSPLLFYDYNIDLLHASPFQSAAAGGGGGSNAEKGTPMTTLSEDYQYLSFRILILILLIKITVQLSMKQEINTYLITLEKLTKVLYTKYHYYSIEVIIYYAIAMKYRVEYEEWCLPCNEFNTLPSSFYQSQLRSSTATPVPQIVPLGANEYLRTLSFTILPWNKKYYQIAKEAGNPFFLKDAIKKMINLYIMISQLPVNPTQLLMETNSQSTTSSHQSNNHLSLPANQGAPTMKELQSLDEALIDEYESNNPAWIYKFSKLRAMQLMTQMKEIGNEMMAAKTTMQLTPPTNLNIPGFVLSSSMPASH